MNNKSKRKTPLLRFKGFTGDWEQRKLGDVSKSVIGGGTPKTSVDEFWDGEIPWLQSSDLIQDNLQAINVRKKITQTAIKKSAAKLIPKGSLAIVTRVGVGKVALVPFDYSTSQDFMSLVELKADSKFVLYAVYKLMDRLSNDVQGTSIKGITKKNLLVTSMWIPENYAEQHQIATLLSKLDMIIALYERKQNLSLKLKQGYLQRLFPNHGDNRPRIRFLGFTNAWEQRKLGEVAPLQRGFDLPKKDIVPGPYPVVFSNGIGAYHNKFKVKGPGIVTGRSGSIGNLTYVENDFWPHNTSLWVTNFLGNNVKFIYYLYNKVNLSRFATGSGVPTLNRNDVHAYSICLPGKSEQGQISRLLGKIDDVIALHERKLNHLIKLKQAYLQQLFI